MTNNRIWLVFRLIKKQKPRTAAIFCGIMFSTVLLSTFCSFGYDFWMQVHQGASQEAEYDFTQKVLILLITVLLLLILLCAAILLYNLYSLTFPRRWQSLMRLLSLGETPGGLAVMGLLESLLLYAAAAPVGVCVSLAAIRRVGVEFPLPTWVWAAILAGICVFSCACNVRPLLSVLSRQEFCGPMGRGYRRRAKQTDDGVVLKCKNRISRKDKYRENSRYGARHFSLFLSVRYRRADRGAHFRTTVTVLAAVLLYVPAGYLIDANISAQQSGLYEKYGIQYSCHPRDKVQLDAALAEYRELAALCEEKEAVGYVAFYTTATVTTSQISSGLRSELKKAGWQESPFLYVDSTIFFLEDEVYAAYTKAPNILINRYTNRSSWVPDREVFFSETPLLMEGADLAGIKVYAAFGGEGEADPQSGISPCAVTEGILEGLDDTGSLSLVMPLSSLEQFCSAGTDYNRLQVQGKFIDSDKKLFSGMEDCLGDHPTGRLIYTRKVIREWYSSMAGIRRAMNAVCATLFFIAVLNVFSMMIFQYRERKKGLAILWSLGQSPGGLLRIMVLESLHHFLAAMLAGIPISVFLCYYIYRIFRQAWQTPFTPPMGQIGLITAAIGAVLGVTALTNGWLMKKQDFLASIKEII